jgi:hypothetical protein
MASGMTAPPVSFAAHAVPEAQQEIAVQSMATSVARSRRDRVMSVAAYEVS